MKTEVPAHVRLKFLQQTLAMKMHLQQFACGVCGSRVRINMDTDDGKLLARYSVCQCKFEECVQAAEETGYFVKVRETENEAQLQAEKFHEKGLSPDVLAILITCDTTKGMRGEKLEKYYRAQLDFTVAELRLQLLGVRCDVCGRATTAELRGNQLTAITCEHRFNHHVKESLAVHHSCRVLEVTAEGVRVSPPDYASPIGDCDMSLLVTFTE